VRAFNNSRNPKQKEENFKTVLVLGLKNRNRKTLRAGNGNPKPRQREGMCAMAEQQLASPSYAALRFNIMPYYSDRADSKEQSGKAAVVL